MVIRSSDNNTPPKKKLPFLVNYPQFSNWIHHCKHAKGETFWSLILSLAYRYIVDFALVDAVGVFIELGVALLIIVTPWGSTFVIRILLIDFWQVHCPMMKIICVVVCDRAPPLPLQCFHGNCFADNIDIINKDGKVYGLKCFLVAEGKEINNIYIFFIIVY